MIATRYSQILLRPDIDPRQMLPLVGMLCRVNNEILKLHKFRDRRRTVGNPGYQFEREKKQYKKDIEITRQVYSGEIDTENDPPRKPQPSTNSPVLPTAPSTPQSASAFALPPDRAQLAASIPTSPPPPAPSPEVPPAPMRSSSRESTGTTNAISLSSPAPDPSLPVPPQPASLENKPASAESSAPPQSPTDHPQPSPSPQPPAPVEFCPACRTPLPPLRPDGERVFPHCPKCGSGLGRPPRPPGPPVECCPACNRPLPPLLPSGQRPSRVCLVCGCGLFPPKTPGPHPPTLKINARVCMFCLTPIPWTPMGNRPSAYCARCHRYLPRIVFATLEPPPDAAHAMPFDYVNK